MEKKFGKMIYYKKFIKEAKNEEDYLIDRLKDLVEVLLPILKEAIDIYPNVKKYKKTTTLMKSYHELWNRIFSTKQHQTSTSNMTPIPRLIVSSGGIGEELKIREYYIYVPDIYTHPIFITKYNRSVVKLVAIDRRLDKFNLYGNLQYDCADINSCNYLVEIEYNAFYKIRFWTKKSNLKKR